MGRAMAAAVAATKRAVRRLLGLDRPPPDYRRHDRSLGELREARVRLARTRRIIARRSGNAVADLASGAYRPPRRGGERSP